MSDGKLDKLTITPVKPSGVPLVCLYNPTTIKISKSVGYKNKPTQANTPEQDFYGGDPFKMSLELFFDTTDTDKSVHEEYTKKLLDLMAAQKKDDVYEPILCELTWGRLTIDWGKDGEDKPFVDKKTLCVISSVNLTFTLFKPDGTPVRAKANVSIEEGEKDIELQNPTSRSEVRRIWQVTEGETIDWIAYREYGDTAQWRHIAETNNLINPQKLRAGQVLKLVPLPF